MLESTTAPVAATTAPAARRNIQVNCTSFGPYTRGNVIPRFECDAHKDITPLINDGLLIETDDPVNVELAARPELVPSTLPAMVDDMNGMRLDLAATREALKVSEERLAESKRQIEAMKPDIADGVIERDRLKKLLEQERTAKVHAEGALGEANALIAKLKAENTELDGLMKSFDDDKKPAADSLSTPTPK